MGIKLVNKLLIFENIMLVIVNKRQAFNLNYFCNDNTESSQLAQAL